MKKFLITFLFLYLNTNLFCQNNISISCDVTKIVIKCNVCDETDIWYCLHRDNPTKIKINDSRYSLSDNGRVAMLLVINLSNLSIKNNSGVSTGASDGLDFLRDEPNLEPVKKGCKYNNAHRIHQVSKEIIYGYKANFTKTQIDETIASCKRGEEQEKERAAENKKRIAENKERENLLRGAFVVYETGGHGLIAAQTDCRIQQREMGVDWYVGDMDWNAAKIACDELVLNGYSDWRLPTKEELNAIYVNLVKSGTRRQSFNIDGIYWSSTENSSDLAWEQTFGGSGTWVGNSWVGPGSQNCSSKTNRCNVRAVRDF